MRFPITLLALVAFPPLVVGVLVGAAPAQAALTFSATASTSDGSPLSAITPGVQITIDVTATTDFPEALGLTAAIYGYRSSMFSLDAAASTVPDQLFGDPCFPTVGCIGGIQNDGGIGPSPPYEESRPDGTARTVIFEGLSLTPATGTGVGQGPQFSIVFDVVSVPAEFETSFLIGTEPPQYTYEGGDGIVNNALIAVTVIPEPTAALLLGLGLAALARRRPRPD